jgi:ABC-type antimicrobial peptide transport system permease subunit
MQPVNATGMCIRAQVRARWRAWAALTLLIGLAGALVLVTAAGARRTGSAYSRFLKATNGADLLVSPNESGSTAYYKALAGAPGVATVAPVIGFGTALASNLKVPLLIDAAADSRLGTVLERPKLTAGRMMRPGSTDEVVADVLAAKQFHLRPGSVLRLEVASGNEELPDPKLKDPYVTVRVVGVGAKRDSIVPVNALASQPSLIAGPAFARRFSPAYYAFDGAFVKLAPGGSKAAFSARAQTLAKQYPETGGGVFVADEHQQAAQVEHAIRPQAVALALFSIFAALAAVIAVAQMLARQIFVASSDNPTLRSLGLGGREMFLAALAPVAASAVVGAVIAVVASILASPLMPIGPARLAEPHPGIAVDWLVLGVGALTIIGLVVLAAAWPAWRASQAAEREAHVLDRGNRYAPRVEATVMRAGAPASTAVGISHAVDPGRGGRAVPMRAALVGVTVAIAAVTGALTFALNLTHLVQTPKLYGQQWDVTADAQFSGIPAAKIDHLLAAEPGVTGWTYGEHGDMTVDGHEVEAVGLTRGNGDVFAPTIVDGHAPSAPDEIALGGKTLDAIHKKVGDDVSVNLNVAAGNKVQTMHVVGQSVLPFFGRGSFTPTGLGVGAQVFESKIGSLNTPYPGQASAPNFVLVRVAPGSHHHANSANVAHDLVSSDACGLDNQCQVTRASRPVDVVNYSRIQATPVALAVLLAILAVLVVAYLLVTSVRRRRRDFAVLKTLGFTRRQVSSAVAWQATTVAMIALVVGLPLGMLIGRLAWSTFATNLGAPSQVTTPVVAILVTIALAVVIANAIAAAPGFVAGRLHPAVVLRAD